MKALPGSLGRLHYTTPACIGPLLHRATASTAGRRMFYDTGDIRASLDYHLVAPACAISDSNQQQCYQQYQQQTPGAGPQLLSRAQEHGSHSLAMRPAENVPVYVMLPLDTVNADGVFRYAYVPWFSQALQVLALSGVHGVAVDVWWCAVERAPRQYCWTGYKQLFEMIRACGLKLQVVLSFHACGGNVGDLVQVPLPSWVLQAGMSDPDIFFTDRPRRESGLGQRNKEYLSIWADDCPVLPAGPLVSPGSTGGSFGGCAAAAGAGGSGRRTPLQCYGEFMTAFRDEFDAQLGSLIEEVVIGSGPCGELRYPSYVEANGWRFPGVGEFQCYDRRALASLAAAAEAAGRPEWGYAGPHDSGGYNSVPLETDFFKPHGGSWDTEYGDFFLSWYSNCLLQHGERLLQLGNQVFERHRKPPPPKGPLGLAQAILARLQQLLAGSNGSSSSSVEEAAAAVVPAAAAAGDGTAGVKSTAAAAAAAGPVEQALTLLQQLLASCDYNSSRAAAVGCFEEAGSNSTNISPEGTAASSTPVGGLTPQSSTQPSESSSPGPSLSDSSAATAAAGAAVACAAAAAAVGGTGAAVNWVQVLGPEVQALASSLLQQLLEGYDTCSNSLALTAASVAGSSPVGPITDGLLPALAAAAAALAATTAAGSGTGAPHIGGLGSGGTTAGVPASPAGSLMHAAHSAALVPLGAAGSNGSAGGVSSSCVSLPAASSLQSSSSALDLAVSDLLSASQQYLSGLALQHSRGSRGSDLSQGASSPRPPVRAAGFDNVAVAAAPASAVDAALLAAAAALGVSGNCSGTCNFLTAAVSSSDMSCSMTPTPSSGSSGSSVATAGRTPVAAGSSGGSIMECSSVPSNSPQSSSSGPFGARSSSGSSLAAADSPATALPAAGSGSSAHNSASPLLQALTQMLSSLELGTMQDAQQQQQCRQQQPRRQEQQSLVLSLKIAGVHWWYNSTSHASELTAGYYNTDTRDGYSAILELCERYSVNLTITCVEMCDAQHPSYALCGPEGLLRQIRAMAAKRKITLSGENALPIFTPNGIDATALDRVVTNVRACRMSPLRSCSSWPGPSSGSGGGVPYSEQLQRRDWTFQQQQQQHQQFMPSVGASSGISSMGDSLHQQQQQQQHTGDGWGQQQHQHQFRRQQVYWYGTDRLGGHQHTGSNILSTSRNFSELGTLLATYGSSGSNWGGSSSSSLQAAPAAAAFSSGGGVWQRNGVSSILSGRPPGAVSSSGHQQQQQREGQSGGGSGGGGVDMHLLPAMRAFTFLRLGPEILQQECHTSWMRFMHRMLNERA